VSSAAPKRSWWEFPAQVCQACPVRDQCTSASRGGRQLTFRPRETQQALDTARAQQTTNAWQAKYALRAGVEGTIHQAVAGIRHARYRGLEKVHLEHVLSAVAVNLIRLDHWWNGHPWTGPAPAISPASNSPWPHDPN
jgi:hypothetical protein